MLHAIVGFLLFAWRAAAVSSSLSAELSQECISQIYTGCIPTIASCAADICYLCTSLGISPSIEPCCAATVPTACFASNFLHGVISSATGLVTLPTEPIPSNLATLSAAKSGSEAISSLRRLSSELPELATSCQSFSSVYARCVASTPDFRHLSFSDLQPCICSTNGTYAGSLYDNYFSGCLKYVSVRDPAEYSAQGRTGGGVLTGVHGSLTFLGSRPCEKYAQITATRTGVSNGSKTASLSSGPGAVSSHGAGNDFRRAARNCVSPINFREQMKIKRY
jgi:hypothetical protein